MSRPFNRFVSIGKICSETFSYYSFLHIFLVLLRFLLFILYFSFWAEGLKSLILTRRTRKGKRNGFINLLFDFQLSLSSFHFVQTKDNKRQKGRSGYADGGLAYIYRY